MRAYSEVRQQRLAIATDKLNVERLNLERSNADLLKTKNQLEEDAHQLNVKIRGLQDQVGSYEKERAAIRTINARNDDSGLWVRVSLANDSDHFEVSIEPSPGKIDWDILGTPNERIDYYPAIRPLLEEMRSIPRLRTLRIGGVELTHREMEGIGELRQLEALHLGHAKLADGMLDPLTNLPRLKRLGIADKGIRNPRPLRQLPAVEILYLSGTSLDDDGLSTLTSIRSLLKLWTDETNITDAGIEHINNFNKLVLIGLRKTKISAPGCLKINLRTLRSLEVSPGLMPQATRDQLHKQLPNLLINDTYDPGSLDSVPRLRTYWAN